MFGFKKTSRPDALEDQVLACLKKIYDPEIPVNIYDLGLIYAITIDANQQVHIQMTLTTPGCPVAQTFPGTVEQKVNDIEAVKACTVELVWDPPWSQDRMTEAARL